MGRSRSVLIASLSFSLLVPFFGYMFLGSLYAALFLTGYLGGFLLWIALPTATPWSILKWPYWLTMLAFLTLHKVEENQTRFFEAVSDRITHTPMPEVTFSLIVSLLIIPVGAWLAIPILIKHEHDFGYFFAWTFFASMGITELAHFGLPLLIHEPYSYFPGMASVIVLAPLAWWGMSRLMRKSSSQKN